MEDTIFAKIIRREIPAAIVYEDDDTIAFLDIAPNNPGHTLIVPKRFARNIFDMDGENWATTMAVVRMVAQAAQQAVEAEGVNIIMNNEPAAGQTVFHAHIHVIPRYEGDGYELWPKKEYKEGEKESVAEKMRNLLS